MTKPGTRKDFNAFIDSQVILYANKIRRDYNLPCPANSTLDYYRVAQLPPQRVSWEASPPASVKVEHIDFRIVHYELSNGQRLPIWERIS